MEIFDINKARENASTEEAANNVIGTINQTIETESKKGLTACTITGSFADKVFDQYREGGYEIYKQPNDPFITILKW